MTTTVISPPDTSTLPNDQAAAVDHAYRRLQALNGRKGTRYEIRSIYGGWAIGQAVDEPAVDDFLVLVDPVLVSEAPLTVLLPHVVNAFVMGVFAGTGGIR